MEQHFRVWKTGGKTPISLAAEDELSDTSLMGGLPLNFMSKLGLLASKACFWF